MAVAAAILGAVCFGVVGTVASMALLGVNCGKRGVGLGWCLSQWRVMVWLGMEWMV